MKILVIDDDPSVQWIINKALGRGYEVLEASTLEEGRGLLRDVQLVFLDIYLPDGSGLQFLEEVLAMEGPPLVVLMTGRGGPETVIEAMKRGAMDYLPKPFDLLRLRSIAKEGETLLKREEEGDRFQEFITRSPAMEEVLKRMGRLAATDLSVLIIGEKGSGKGAAAQYMHIHSSRGEGPLVFFTPARLPAPRVEAELFGKGGKLERAQGGTLVIQHVEDLVPEVQDKLLTVLEQGEHIALGGRIFQLEARIMATTSSDLPRLVVEGGFNEDLFLRLQTLTLEIPPLRERAEDVPPLAEYFLQGAAEAARSRVRGFTSQAMEAFMRYRWPGNVKELKEVVERLVTLSRGQLISLDLLPLVIRENREEPPFILYLREEVQRMLKEGEEDIYGKVLEQVEKVLLEEVLGQTQGNQIRASRILGVHRNTIRRKLFLFGRDS